MLRQQRFGLGALASSAAALGIVFTFGSGRASAQVLEQVPADAAVVIKVKSLSDVSGKVAALAQQWGLAGMNPAMADPLAALQQEAGITEGLAKEGEMAIVIPTLPEEEGAEPPVVMLVPVTDYKAFLGNFQAQPGGDVTNITMKNGEPGFVAQWGNYAALSETEAVVAKPAQQGLSVKGATAKELGAKDMVLYVNMNVIREQVVPKLKEARAEILKEIDEQAAQVGEEGEGEAAPEGEEQAEGQAEAPEGEQAAEDPAAAKARAEAAKKYVPVAKAAVNQMMNTAEGFFNTADAITYGVNLSNDGISTTFMTEFKPESYAAKVAKQLTGSKEEMLAGLPDAKYLFLAGTAIDPKVSTQVLNDLMGPIEKELANLGPEVKPFQQYMSALRKYVGASTGGTLGMVAPSGQLGQEAIFQVINVMTGDAKALAAAQVEMINAQEGLMAAFAAAAPEAAAAQSKTPITPNAKQVDGVSLSQFTTQMNLGEDANPQAQQMNQMMQFMYGPGGPSGYFGVVDDKHAIVVSGAGEELLASAVQAAKANEAAVAKNEQIAAVAKQLPQQRIAVAYVPIDNIVSTGVTYANQFGMQTQLQLPPDLPPLGFTVSTEAGTAYRVDAHIPSQTVQALIAAGMQMAMQMQGGQQPGGPGGL